MQIILSPSIQPSHWWLSLAPETSDRDSIVPSNRQSLGRDSVCDNLFSFRYLSPVFCRYVLSYSILFYPVLFYPSVCVLPSGVVWSCSVLSLVVLHCSVWSCCVSSHYVHSCPLWADFPTFCPRPSPPVLSCTVLPYPFLLGQLCAFGHVLASPILFFPALYYLRLYHLVLYFLDYHGPCNNVNTGSNDS